MTFHQRLSAVVEAFRLTPKKDHPNDNEEENLAHHSTMFRPAARLLEPALATSNPPQPDDRQLVERIVTAYNKAIVTQEDPGSFWSSHYGGIRRDIHDTLMSGDFAAITRALRNPMENNLFYGFDGICLAYADLTTSDEHRGYKRSLYGYVVRIAEAIAAARVDNAEAALKVRRPLQSLDELIECIEKRLGFTLQFPNPYPQETGLASKAGIISYRALQALFQAWLIRHHAKSAGAKVVEIGAGLGRTAFFTSLAGIKDYTIVDLPLTNVAQAYFLGRTLGPERISLYGEAEVEGAIRIIPPDAFFASDRRFDIALNADSLPEMSPETAMAYLKTLAGRCPQLISINHEFNPFTVAELCAQHPAWTVDRTPYWMRQGYVQEIIRF